MLALLVSMRSRPTCLKKPFISGDLDSNHIRGPRPKSNLTKVMSMHFPGQSLNLLKYFRDFSSTQAFGLQVAITSTSSVQFISLSLNFPERISQSSRLYDEKGSQVGISTLEFLFQLSGVCGFNDNALSSQ